MTLSEVTQRAELGKKEGQARTFASVCLNACLGVLSKARSEDYAGFSKFDALNSPLVNSLAFNNKWLRLIFTQVVNRSPWHIRPLLGVHKSRNAKGIALFVRACLFLWQSTEKNLLKNEAETLLGWLEKNRAHGATHRAWGYNFVWQNTIFLQKANEPNCVVTVFVGEAFLQAYRAIGKESYLHVARDIARFIMEDLPVLHDGKDEKAIGYVLRGNDSVVLNINALAGSFLVKVWEETKEDACLEFARKLIAFTVRRRTSYDAWYYTHPKEKSPITHDNYHTGGILDALLEYFEATGDDKYQNVYWKGLEYYRSRLFEADGAPRWMNDKKYPFDVHGAAQGIITFTKAARHRLPDFRDAGKTASWALENLYRPRTQDFAYRQGRYFKWNYSLMRWCNAWMTRALAEYYFFYDEQDKAQQDDGS